MNRRCFRNLDKPFEVFLGLGPLDLVLIAVVGLVLMTIWNAPAGLIGGTAFDREALPGGQAPGLRLHARVQSRARRLDPREPAAPGAAPGGGFLRGEAHALLGRGG